MNKNRIFESLIAVALVCVFACGCGSSSGSAQNATRSDEEIYAEAQQIAQALYGKSEDETEDVSLIETFSIETPYLTFRYPSKWENYTAIQTNKDGDLITFFAVDTPIFDITINRPEGDFYGTVVTDNGNYEIRVTSYYINIDDTELASTAKEMQDDINILISCLQQDYTFLAGVHLDE